MGIEVNYYLNQEDSLRRNHLRFVGLGKPVLQARYGEEFTESVIQESCDEFARLIPEIPYIGGRQNSFTELMIQSASLLAIYRSMKRHGKTLEEIGALVHEMAEAWVNKYPHVVRRWLGRLYMSGFWQKRTHQKARLSQERRYPGNFVYEVVEGDGRTYDWGVNYLECGIVKFFHQQGADELASYMCRLDYLLFPALGIRLNRQGTIAQGCSHCDFRFQKGLQEV